MEGGKKERQRRERTGEDWVTQQEKSSVTSIKVMFHREIGFCSELNLI